MTSLGLRFTNKEYTYAVMNGKFDTAAILSKESFQFPRNYSRPKALVWLYKELTSLITTKNVSHIRIKGMEPLAAKNGLAAIHRLENEALVYLIAGQLGIDNIERVVDATVASKLRLTGAGKRSQSYRCCEEMFGDGMDDKTKDAVLAVWAKME